MKIGTRDGVLIAALEENLKHLVMKWFAVSLFLVATALSVSNCGSSASLISGDQMLILETPYPNDHSFHRAIATEIEHRAIATEIEDGFKVASDWGRGEFDSNTIRIEFSIDHDIKVGHEVPMEHCYFGYPYSSNFDDKTFTIKSGHVYLKSRTDDQIVVRFKNACFSLSADRDYLLNGDLSFSISQ